MLLLFAGPTLYRARAMGPLDLRQVTVLPPAIRGAVERVVRQRPGRPGTLALVDGTFHLGTLAVGHAELRRALEAGWQVWGLSSMGAIRARELASLGMRGYGEVFTQFCGPGDFTDDEVALLHEPAPPYRELSEPLCHLRVGLQDLERSGALKTADCAQILEELTALWFGDRTLRFALDRLAAVGVPAVVRDEWLRGFDRYRVKSVDLLRFLRDRPFAPTPLAQP